MRTHGKRLLGYLTEKCQFITEKCQFYTEKCRFIWVMQVKICMELEHVVALPQVEAISGSLTPKTPYSAWYYA